jgi:hypothetical protein
MNITFKDNILIFDGLKKMEEKIVSSFLRTAFEKNGFNTDRCFKIPEEKFLGVRVYLGTGKKPSVRK